MLPDAYLAKKMKNVLSQEKTLRKSSSVHDPKPLEEEQIQLFLFRYRAISGFKSLSSTRKWDFIPLGERVLAQGLQLTVRGQEKIGIIGPNGIGNPLF